MINAAKSTSAHMDHTPFSVPNYSTISSGEGQHQEPRYEVYSYAELQESKSIVEKFLNKPQAKSKAKSKNTAFNRLYAQAVVKQKVKREREANLQKSGKKLKHSKSSYLTNNVQTVGAKTSRVRKVKKHDFSSKKDLEYTADIGHRLYLKGRGVSNKRAQSIRKERRRKSMRITREEKSL